MGDWFEELGVFSEKIKMEIVIYYLYLSAGLIYGLYCSAGILPVCRTR